jgi:RNA polymerase sigma factor, sigma-70 family
MNIINLLRDRDERGLTMLYDDYAPALLGIISGIVHHHQTAEEVLQETFLKVWTSIEGYNHKRGTFFTWMATIARHKAIDKVRLKSFGASEELDTHKHGGSATMSIDSIMDSQQLLATLDPNQSKVLALIYLSGMSQQQTAEALDIPLGTVKTRIRLALKALRDELDGEKQFFTGSVILIILMLLIIWN